jgi:hypothetical protein
MKPLQNNGKKHITKEKQMPLPLIGAGLAAGACRDARGIAADVEQV